MNRILLCLLCALWAALPLPVEAQQKPAPPAPPAPPAISAEQARMALLEVLNDPAKLAAVAATWNAIVKAQPGPAAQGQPAEVAKPAEPAPDAQGSLVAQVPKGAETFMRDLGTRARLALDKVQSLPLLWDSVKYIVENPVKRELAADVAWRVALALTAAAAVEFSLRRLARRLLRRLEGAAPAKPATWAALRRALVVLARLGLETVPALGIVVVGWAVAGSFLGGQANSRLTILAVTYAYALCAALLGLTRMLLSPALLRVEESAAAYLTNWTRRLVFIAFTGYALGEAWLFLNVSPVAHDAFQKGVGLVLCGCLGFIVLRNREAVRVRLSAPEGHFGPAATWRNRAAAGWHGVALFCIASGWIVWAIELPLGYGAALRYVLATGALLFGTRLVLLPLGGGLERLIPAKGDGSGIYARLRLYMPLLAWGLRLVVYLLAGLALLQLYGLDALTWLQSDPWGRSILSSAAKLVTTVVLALAVWEAVNTAVQRHLDKLHREAQLARSARLRTLLPLLRTALMVAIFVVAGLTVLSEIGINIAPLLAGAGIMGVAIGFGSQKLVQDLITGISLLLENAMQVGDWVTVSGLSGKVEALSVRTIRLRALDGSVHIIPFSSVTSVTNVNRGIGNAAVNVTVEYGEDTDRVSEELKGIVSAMRDEPDLGGKMLSDLQLWGVDKLDGASVTIAGQVVCTDSGRWAVQREFNRRMIKRFQELGIKVFNPLQTIAVSTAPYDMEDRSG
jgi:hypothetical protein